MKLLEEISIVSILVVLGFYIPSSCYMVMIGAMNSGSKYTEDRCKGTITHSRLTTYTGLKYFYRVGCYLGEHVE